MWQYQLAPVRAFCKLLLKTVQATFAVAVLKTPVSMRWFVAGWLGTLAAVWVIVALYFVLASHSYVSKWTLILPTSSSGTSMQVESIGHAQTISSSPFGSTTLSPKVIYKEIISSEDVLSSAAASINMTPGEFGLVRVKLIDETALMYLEIAGRTAEIAKKKATALMVEFERQLDLLRNDEIERRADVVNHSLRSYQQTLLNVRAKILEHQKSTGVLSINQFNEAATSLELTKRKLSDAKAELRRLQTERDSMSAIVGLQPQAAAAMLRLSADPAFLKVAGEYADCLAKYQEDAAQMGDANPILAVVRERYIRVATLFHDMTRRAGVDLDAATRTARVVMNGTHRSDLIKSVVTEDAAAAGKQQEIELLEVELRNQVDVVGEMSNAVSRLEDLKKDHLLAEAIFTSALARLDTNKTDIYASYPMVQTLASPDLSNKMSSPNLLIGFLFGIGATLLSTAAWGIAWLRHIFLQNL